MSLICEETETITDLLNHKIYLVFSGAIKTRTHVCPPAVESLFPPVLWSSCTQAPLACKADALGAPPPDARPSG